MSAPTDTEIIPICPPNAPFPDRNQPWLVKAIVALFDFLQARKDLLRFHKPACDCELCTDIGGMGYPIELFLHCLQAQAFRSPTITQREEEFLAS
jgi:hypothetical protein